MKIVLEVKESKVDFLLALLNDLPYVKAMPINDEEDGRFLDEIREAVKDVNLIKKGKLKGRPVEELLNEL
ncbi:hypothetical protein FXV77_06995 [Sphingobacterium phlebotomi]|jgi:hypothetical protein|uniref:Uncharacterized protein n=1 Tax=Sphingobacterium phlebotomi TaxID=2605433 RepID=A0A5D4HAS4_9SPHI|nr:hypothetical protein [Sphingobacterium phlebotomi]TYR36919.1 hypothetical protein FXV77_06995 [Sphingobacterium phlebotomi]